MKAHYFDDEKADQDDIQLKMAIMQGYVPPTCLIVGAVAMSLVNKGEDPCAGCNGPRNKCNGRAKQTKHSKVGW